jgi:hypothetical protein
VQAVLGDVAHLEVFAFGNGGLGMGETVGVDNVSLTGSDTDSDNDGVANDVDLCPTAAGPGPSGCRAVSRTLTLRYAKGARAFKGRLTPAGPCSVNEKVRVYKKRPGPDPWAGKKGVTRANGRYKAHFRRRRGTYYARVEANREPTQGNCLAVKSNILQLG